MIEAYIVRDPQGRVIGMSVSGYDMACRDAIYAGEMPASLYNDMVEGHKFKQDANVNRYTLTREQVAL
jgi:hypothetical protein